VQWLSCTCPADARLSQEDASRSDTQWLVQGSVRHSPPRDVTMRPLNGRPRFVSVRSALTAEAQSVGWGSGLQPIVLVLVTTTWMCAGRGCMCSE
jgi:hypothetical protein